MFRTTSTDRTVIEALIDAGEDPRARTRRGRGPGHRRAQLPQALLLGAVDPRPQADAATPSEGKPVGLMLPNANGAAVTLIALMSAGRVPAMINFTAGAANILAACKAAKLDTIVTSRAFIEQGKLDDAGRGDRARGEDRLPRGCARDGRRSPTSFAGCWTARSRWCRAMPTIGPRSCSRRAPKACRKASCCPTATCWRTPRRPRARIDFGRQDKVFNVLPVFHSFGLTVGLVLPLVSGVRDLSLSVAAALPHRAGTGLRHERDDPVRHRHVPQRLCARRARLRLPLAALHSGRRRAGEGFDATDLSWRNSACASWKAMA